MGSASYVAQPRTPGLLSICPPAHPPPTLPQALAPPWRPGASFATLRASARRWLRPSELAAPLAAQQPHRSLQRSTHSSSAGRTSCCCANTGGRLASAAFGCRAAMCRPSLPCPTRPRYIILCWPPGWFPQPALLPPRPCSKPPQVLRFSERALALISCIPSEAAVPRYAPALSPPPFCPHTTPPAATLYPPRPSLPPLPFMPLAPLQTIHWAQPCPGPVPGRRPSFLHHACPCERTALQGRVCKRKHRSVR